MDDRYKEIAEAANVLCAYCEAFDECEYCIVNKLLEDAFIEFEDGSERD